MSGLKFGSVLKELRVHLCQKNDASRGARDFIEKYYVSLKYSNPKFPILVRECSGVQPRLWARFDHGKETSISLSNLKSEEIYQQLNNLVKK